MKEKNREKKNWSMETCILYGEQENMLGTYSLYDSTRGKTHTLILMIALWVVGPWSSEAPNKPTLPINLNAGLGLVFHLQIQSY